MFRIILFFGLYLSSSILLPAHYGMSGCEKDQTSTCELCIIYDYLASDWGSQFTPEAFKINVLEQYRERLYHFTLATITPALTAIVVLTPLRAPPFA